MLLQWILSRETHSSRAIAAIIAAALLTLLSLYVLLESALKAVGQPSWLASPQDWAGWVAALPAVASTALLGISGVVILLVGLLFFLQAVLPGRRARLVMPSRRAAVVVDAEVLASSLARRARLAAGVRPEQVLVIVSRRQAEVQLRPTSGIPVRPETVQAAVEEELERTGVRPRPQVRVRIAERGVVGQ